MKSRLARSLTAVVLVAPMLAVLVGCAASPTNTHPAVEPVTISAATLQGTTVKVALDGELNITTGSLAVTSYSGTIADTSIAKFVPGSSTSSAQFDPSVKPLKIGKTTVTLRNKNGGIQDVTFTLDVTK